MIEIIKNNEKTYSIIVRSNYNKEGPNFFTDNHEKLQLGNMIYEKGKLIEPHYHKNINRSSNKAAEALFIKKGKIKVSFFCPESSDLIEEKILNKNDVILIQDGAHGFEVIEKVEMIEVKLGPYLEDDRIHLNDKK